MTTQPPKKSKSPWKRIRDSLAKQGLMDRVWSMRDSDDDDQTYTVYGNFSDRSINAIKDHYPVTVKPFVITGVRVWKKNRRLSEQLRFVNHIAYLTYGDRIYFCDEASSFGFNKTWFAYTRDCPEWDDHHDRCVAKVDIWKDSQSFYWTDRVI